MNLDLESQSAERSYSILAALITPRPIALITTLGPDGIVNAAPFSFFNVMGANPPIIAFAPGDRGDGTPKDTALNVRIHHEFVVNLVDEPLAEAMVRCAAPLPYGESELTSAGLTAVASSVVKPPRIAEAPASLECAEWGTLRVGGNRMIIGLVRMIHLRDDTFDVKTGRVCTERLALIGRLTGPWYCRTRSRFEIARPE